MDIAKLKTLTRPSTYSATPDVFTYSTLIDGSCKASRLALARQLFTEMRAHGVAPDVFTYSSLLDGLCKSARLDEVVAILEDMDDKGIKEGACSPNDITYNTIIRGYILYNDLMKALYYRDVMISQGFEADARTFSLFVGLMSSGNLSDSSKVLLQKFLEGDCNHGNVEIFES